MFNERRGFASIIVIIIGLAAIMAFAGWKSLSKSPAVSQPPAAQSEASSSVPHAEVSQQAASSSVGVGVDISGWKTYRNDKYGFEFKYPGELFSGANNYDGGLITLSDKKDFENEDATLVFSLSVNEFPTAGTVSIASVKQIFHLSKLQERLQTDISDNVFDVESPWSYYNISIRRKPTFLKTFLNVGIRINQRDNPSYGGTYKYQKFVDQILSTLKFGDETMGWKTYNDGRYEFKYPLDWEVQAYLDGANGVEAGPSIYIGSQPGEFSVSTDSRFLSQVDDDFKKAGIIGSYVSIGGQAGEHYLQPGFEDIFLSRSGRTYHIRLIFSENPTIAQQTREILSTFKFVEPAAKSTKLPSLSTKDERVNWKIYKTPYFELTIPPEWVKHPYFNQLTVNDGTTDYYTHGKYYLNYSVEPTSEIVGSVDGLTQEANARANGCGCPLVYIKNLNIVGGAGIEYEFKSNAQTTIYQVYHKNRYKYSFWAIDAADATTTPSEIGMFQKVMPTLKIIEQINYGL